MASSSSLNQNLTPMAGTYRNFVPYPDIEAPFKVILNSPKTFMAALEKFHDEMGTKFMIPIIGGRSLNLHKLFVEVTARGGIDKILSEKKWKEVTALFNFPSTATNASFVLRKYYCSLLRHFEQCYYFQSRGYTPIKPVPIQSLVVAQSPPQVPVQPSMEYQTASGQQQIINTNPTEHFGVRPVSPATPPVVGVIDGKFEGGYLVTVTVGSEELKGVLYQAPKNQSCMVQPNFNASANSGINVHTAMSTQRRRRRKKNEIKRRDPAHPKPNRSGYNFFFAEQHARLKQLHPGRDREISRMIGDLWNNANDAQKMVYQEKALQDKERYRIEMEDYKEKLKSGLSAGEAIPRLQWLPEKDVDMVEVNVKIEETEGANSPGNQDNHSSYDESDSGDDKTGEKGMGGFPIND